MGRCLWMRMDAGPDDAAERIVGDRHVGFGLGDVRMGRRGVLSGGARLLGDGVGLGPGAAFVESVLTFIASN